AGLEAVVLVPAGATALGKLSQSVAYGARVVRLEGDFDAGMRLVREHAEALELYVVNSLNPFRVEGQKTIVLDLLQQERWRAPDWIVFPAGNLGNAAAFGKALREALAHGWIERAPRLLAVQAAGAAPFHASFEGDFARLEPVHADTLATAIKIGAPVSFRRAVRAIRETNGAVLAVDDDAILDAKAAVDAAGIGAEPASCASVAGLKQAVATGLVARHERCVCILTGHLLKDPETTLAYHEGTLAGVESRAANRPVTIAPTPEALARALGE
ncbi:MAG: pyridoxal-phosphate dependent enzyme, partial [Gemmatimonadetes bacterium]|nr:pyridoxal-phosphate dependent enzyme [Gemmatimonadota bacterium]